MRKYSVGDPVVYHKPKVSSRPGPRAEAIHPSGSGEDYAYAVNKYWTVTAVVDETTIEIVTRRGKIHQLKTDDPCLRKASLLERLLYRKRFPTAERE